MSRSGHASLAVMGLVATTILGAAGASADPLPGARESDPVRLFHLGTYQSESGGRDRGLKSSQQIPPASASM